MTREFSERQLAAARERLAAREVEAARDRADLVDDREVGQIISSFAKGRLRAEGIAAQTAVPADVPSWEWTGGHVSVQGRIAMEEARARRAKAMEMAGDPDWREPEEEPPLTVTFAEHEQAGLMRLATDGRSWFLRIRGVDLPCGPARRRERKETKVRDEDRTIVERVVTWTPRPDVIAAAAQLALGDPWGPEQPVGSVVFTSDARGEPVAHVVGGGPAPTAQEYGAAELRRTVITRERVPS
jgi:hypothetical protein